MSSIYCIYKFPFVLVFAACIILSSNYIPVIIAGLKGVTPPPFEVCFSSASEIVSYLIMLPGILAQVCVSSFHIRLQFYLIMWLLLLPALVYFYFLSFFVHYCVAVCLFLLSFSVSQSGKEHVCQMTHVVIVSVTRSDGWFALWWGTKYHDLHYISDHHTDSVSTVGTLGGSRNQEAEKNSNDLLWLLKLY